MSLLVTGSIGIDTVTTPQGRAQGVLGGSAMYFSAAASFFSPVRLVGVVGGDFPEEFRGQLSVRGVDVRGLEVRPNSKTFRWTGKYQGDMNLAETVDVKLNVLSEDSPRVPTVFADSEFVFLANTHPTRQRQVLDQLHSPRVIVCDTMNLWISNERDSLMQTLSKVHGVIINDAEARQLTGLTNVIEAGVAILKLGPKFVMIKKGEHGSFFVTADSVVAIPGYPSREVRDPTGAGDSFAGGVMGSIAKDGRMDLHSLRRAMVYGTVLASFAIEDFSNRRLVTLTRSDIDRRAAEFVSMLRIDV